MGALAITYGRLGKHTNAEKLEIKVLDIRNTLLGEEHPNTICAMSNLAITHGILGKYTDAKKLQIKVVDKRTRIFGEGHPDTIQAVALLTPIKSQGDTNTSGTQPRKTGESYIW